jgi:hypothetical protein
MSDIFKAQTLKLEFTIVDQDGVVVDLSAVTSYDLEFRKPDGVCVTKTPSFVTDGTDGKIQYTTLTTDLDQAGSWSVQSIVIDGANDYPTETVSFVVQDRLC